MVEVTQEDRKAAASVAVLVEMRELILAGKADHHAEPWAAHRIAALEEAAKVAIEALTEAREALHFHYVEWDGDPEDAVPLQLARSRCDAAIRALKGPTDDPA